MRKQLAFIGPVIAFALYALSFPLAASAATVNVSMQDDFFTPQTITVNAGDTIVWTNNGSMAHTVTADNGLFNSGSIAPGSSFTQTFTSAGTYAYHCQFHGASGGVGMAGVIVVQAAQSTSVPLSQPTLTAGQVGVSLTSAGITPATLDVNAGTTVVWTNTSGTPQFVIGNNNLFQSGSIAAGAQFAATFNTAGTYNYYDNANGSAIVGEIIVSGSTASNISTVQSTYNPNSSYYTNTASTSNNPTVSSLTSEVQALIAQINAIEGNSGGTMTMAPTGGYTAPSYTAGGSCPQVGRVLSIGTSGSDVTSVQQFLGVSPATGYFGTITQAAVEQWQASNNIISYGTPATTGYGVVGPRTAAAIRLACGSGSSGSGGSNPAATGVVSGTLQVTPISGPAPLTSTVTVTANTAGSCSGGTYSVNYGDNTQNQVINVPVGNCSPLNQSFQHTYQYGGTYTVTLSAGSHSSTAIVTVSGPSTSVTSTPSPNQASGSMSAFITQGPAPLSTTFYISCASGLAYDVVFGDGSDLGSSGVSQSSCDGGLQSVAHTYTKSGSYTAQLVVFTRNALGTVSSQGVAEQGITVTGGSSPSSAPGTGTSSFSPPSLTPNVGSNPLAVSLQFTAGTCSNAYNIAWGDNAITPAPQVDSQGGCNQSTTQTQSITHTYTAAGQYTVTLTRQTSGTASQTNTVAVSISN